MGALRRGCAALCAFLLLVTAACAFDQALLGQSDRALQDYRTSLDRVVETLRRPSLSEKDLADSKAALEKLRTSAAETSLKLAAPLQEVNQQIDSLGPAPAAGAAEDAGVAKARADLGTSRDRLQSLKSQFDVIAVEAEQASGRVSTLQREQFFERIFDRNRSIFSPSLWQDTGVGFGALSAGLGLLFRNWWAEVSQTGDPVGLLLVPLFIIVFAGGYLLVNRWARSWAQRFSGRSRSIDDMARLWRIVRGVITATVAAAILFVPIRLSLDASGYMTPRMMLVWTAVVTTIGFTLLYFVLSSRIAAPGRPEWRIVDLDDRAASRFTLLAGITAFVAAFNTQLSRLAEGLYVGVTYTAGQSAFCALVLFVLVSLILLTVRNQEGLPNPSGRRFYFQWAARLTPLIWLLIIIGCGALVAGYLSLANYIAHQMVRTSMVLAALMVLYHLFDATVTASFDPQSGFGIFLRRITGLGERAIERLGLVIRTAVDIVFILAGVPFLLLLWTLTWVDFGGFLNTLALGVQIGNVTLSPGLLLLVLTILVAGIVITKLFNRWLERRILHDTRINRGVQDSILKGATYTGYIIAAAVALTAAGVDFSSIALVAGALGLGIGLGLQSIVNNFVSGLILLAERPIRVGDWVSIAAGEGVVRRINVRSTEIETFDSCSIILPNSALVTEAVRNWTHNDNMGRFLVAVTVDYDSDPEVVRKLLIEAARGHPKVLTSPAPAAILARFGANGFDFELRAYVSDIFEGSGVASDIRFRLVALFREKGITIAQPVGLMQPPKA